MVANVSDQIAIQHLNFCSHDGKSSVHACVWTLALQGRDFGGSQNQNQNPNQNQNQNQKQNPNPNQNQNQNQNEPRQGDPADDKTPPVKGIIQIVHGMAEHSARYDHVASYFVQRGYVVCAEDHVGHGKTASSAKDLGHIPAHGGKDILLGDVHTLRRMMQERYPQAPYILYGHSMGSFIVRSYAAWQGDGLAAIVLSGTGNIAPALSRFGRGLARMLAAVRGERYRSGLIDGMGAGGYGKKISDAQTPLDWLSTDVAVVEAYQNDPLCGFMFTVGGYATLLDLTAEVATPECAARVPKMLPCLFIAGDKDPVGDNGSGVKAAAQLLEEAGVQEVKCILYPDARHEIHNEFCRQRVFGDVAAWLDAVLSDTSN